MSYEPVHLNRRDYKCHCGCGKNKTTDTLMQWVDDAYWVANNMIFADEDAPDFEFEINSGYRCIRHNNAVGGSKTSSHLKGEAVDIKCLDSRFRYYLIKALLDVGFERIGIAKTFIHADIDEDKDPEVVWLY